MRASSKILDPLLARFGAFVRRCSRFSLRAALVAMLVAAWWLAGVHERAEKQRKAVEFLEAREACLWWDWQFARGSDMATIRERPYPEWLEQLAGRDLLYTVVVVDFRGTAQVIDDEDLRCLADLPYLRGVDLSGTGIRGESLRHLAGSTRLRWLHLMFTKVDDEGMTHLEELQDLRFLNLIGSQVSDRGIESVAKLRRLEMLMTGEILIGPESADRLAKLPRLRRVTAFFSTQRAFIERLDDLRPKVRDRFLSRWFLGPPHEAY